MRRTYGMTWDSDDDAATVSWSWVTGAHRRWAEAPVRTSLNNLAEQRRCLFSSLTIQPTRETRQAHWLLCNLCGFLFIFNSRIQISTSFLIFTWKRSYQILRPSSQLLKVRIEICWFIFFCRRDHVVYGYFHEFSLRILICLFPRF